MAGHQRWKRLNWVHSNLKGTAPPPPCFKPFLCRSLDIVLGYIFRGNMKGARMWIFYHFMLICNTSNSESLNSFWKIVILIQNEGETYVGGPQWAAQRLRDAEAFSTKATLGTWIKPCHGTLKKFHHKPSKLFLHGRKIWSGVTDALLTHSQTLKDSTTQLLVELS